MGNFKSRKGYISGEVWRPIPDYEGIYIISNIGRVKSLDRLSANGHRLKGRLLKPSNPTNKWAHTLCKDGGQKQIGINRLVYTVFVGKIPDDMEVVFIGSSDDMRPCNLRLQPIRTNAIAALPTEFDKPQSKLRPEDIKNIHRLSENGMSLCEISARYSVSRNSISLVLRGVSYTDYQKSAGLID